jgi:hypothetical protein
MSKYNWKKHRKTQEQKMIESIEEQVREALEPYIGMPSSDETLAQIQNTLSCSMIDGSYLAGDGIRLVGDTIEVSIADIGEISV